MNLTPLPFAASLHPAAPPPGHSLLARGGRAVRGVVLAGVVVVSAGSAAWVASKESHPAAEARPAAASPAADKPEAIRRADDGAVVVPRELARNMGLHTAEAAAASRPVALAPFQGVLALDSDRLARVHSPFAGEVVRLGNADGSGDAESLAAHPVRVGDAVKAGQLLAVVWSRDLGEKKSEMVDALARLRADETTLRKIRAAYQEGGSVPERSVRDAEQAVNADRVAADRAERTLRTWRLTDDQIAAVRAEADRLAGPSAASATSTTPADWARVEVHAKQDGVVLEKNVAVGDIVDTANDLFKIGDVAHLIVWAHAYEEDLPLLQGLDRAAGGGVAWTVRLPSRPGASFHGTLDRVGAVIDPNQHTALVTGRVENPAGELRAGQFVTAAVEMPPPAGQVELPAEAVIEDGRESAVFVQPDPAESRFVRAPVRVTRRFRDVIYVQPDGLIRPGARVVTGGALLLSDAAGQLPAAK